MSWSPLISFFVVLIVVGTAAWRKRRRATREREQAALPDRPVRPPLGDYDERPPL